MKNGRQNWSSMNNALSYDDILLYPQQGVLKSRKDADVHADLGKWKLRLPVISSPMETVTDGRMAYYMAIEGCLGVIHRFQDAKTIHEWVLIIQASGKPAAIAIGYDDWERAAIPADILVLDVAHADTKAMLTYLERIKAENPDKLLVAGSVATYNGARRLINAGADILRVGIGAGAACTTREVTGFGVPMVTSIQECASVAASFGKQIIADGGIKTTGDIVKALAIGADYVMMGRMFADVREAPRPGEYFGQASNRATEASGRHVEGASGTVEVRGSLAQRLNDVEDAIRSGVSYGGGRTIEEMRLRAVPQTVTPLAMIESGVRI